MGLAYGPASEPLHISVNQLFLNWAEDFIQLPAASNDLFFLIIAEQQPHGVARVKLLARDRGRDRAAQALFFFFFFLITLPRLTRVQEASQLTGSVSTTSAQRQHR